MLDHFPNNVFIPDEIQKQIDAIEFFFQSFKEKYKEIFDKDLNNEFIEFKWESFPIIVEAKRSKISFDIQYDGRLPLEIRNEFQEYINQFKS